MPELEHITFIQNIVSDSGTNRTLLGTRSRLYESTGDAGNFRILLDGTGGQDVCVSGVPQYRWKSAQVGNFVILINGIDQVYSYRAGDPPSTTPPWPSAQLVDDLVALGVTAPKVISQFKGFVAIANFVESGNTRASVFRWSDFDGPLEWLPGGDSLAGEVDFGGGETVLAALPIGGKWRIYTDQAIYDGVFVDNTDEVFRFQEVYRGPDVPYFYNTLVTTGDAHLWMSRRTILYMTEFDVYPREIPWMHNSAGFIYNGLDEALLNGLPTGIINSFCPISENLCYVPVSGYDPKRNQLWFSWASGSNSVNDVSMVLSPRTETACIYDHGFTAFGNVKLDERQSMRGFQTEYGICPSQVMLNEGNPSYCPPDFTPTTAPVLYNTTEFTANFDADAGPDTDSLCNILAEYCFDCPPCSGEQKFVMASAEDKSLKEYVDDFYCREIIESRDDTLGWCQRQENSDSIYTEDLPDGSCPNPTVSATYTARGYASIVQSDASNLGKEQDKIARKMSLDYDAQNRRMWCDDEVCTDTAQAVLRAQIGAGGLPGCLEWIGGEERPISCITGTYTPAKPYLRQRPGVHYDFYNAGKYIAFRWWTGSTDPSVVKPGSIGFNSLTINVSDAQCEWR